MKRQTSSTPENAAITLNASVEALLKHMPQSEAEAATQAELFAKHRFQPRLQARRALRRLLEAGQIQRVGKGTGRRNADPYRYWLRGGV